MRSILLSLAGYYCLAFAVFHMMFWKLFRWKADLQRLTPVNRSIMQVLNIRLIYVFLVVGIAVFLFGESMLASDVGKFLLGAMSVFWLMRSIEQLVFFDATTLASTALVVVFVIGSALFAIPLFL